jgi:hypothetical protein
MTPTPSIRVFNLFIAKKTDKNGNNVDELSVFDIIALEAYERQVV